ncbi:MAG: diiron oxygenase [Pseudonocardiaceae bacterium]|nr:diiron oxygenase [Pseudonocardiaceae bacterium]
MTTTDTPPRREVTAGRLLKTAARHSYDPDVDIDWDAPLAGDRYFHPPHRSSLYGTQLWERMSEAQRIELTKHETASIACMGIWFETILMQMLIRHAYDTDPATAHTRFTYTEIAEECRHSKMFARMVEKFGCPGYGTGPVVHHLGRAFKALSNGTLTFSATMYVEEILDALQREMMADETIEPIPREVSRVHVIEEARHIHFARDELLRQWPKLGRGQRAVSRLVLGVVVYLATTRLIDPKVYANAGLDVDEAVRTATANPHWRESKRFAARKITTFLGEQGLIKGPGRIFWRRAGLVD